MLRQPSPLIALLLLPIAPLHAADEGRLKATGGLVTIEAAAGGGLVPWAVMAGSSTRPGVDVVAGFSATQVADFRLASLGLSASWNDRFELSLGRQQFTVDRGLLPAGIDRRIGQTVLGAKLRIAGDLIYGDLPQMAIGLQYKHSDSDVLAGALGARCCPGRRFCWRGFLSAGCACPGASCFCWGAAAGCFCCAGAAGCLLCWGCAAGFCRSASVCCAA